NHESFEQLILTLQNQQHKLSESDQILLKQPHVVLCGPLDNVTCSHVKIDRFIFDFKTCVEAVDFLYKSFFVLSIDYPSTCPHVWSFLQKHIFEMDKERRLIGISKINLLVSDLQNCQLYENLRLNKTDVQFIIETMQNFIKDCYNPFLLNKLQSNLHNAINKEISTEITETFEKYRDPFFKYSSENKRMRIYKNMELYTDPEECQIGSIQAPIGCGSINTITDQTVSMIHIPLKKSLKKLLEINGLFDATLSYMNSLKNEKNVLMNFVQGPLWSKQIENFEKKNEIVLPLFVHSDDVETGNALGSHAGINKVGAVYVTVACFPPSFSSKLDSLILSDIFHANDRKTYGNYLIFRKLIEELNELRINGIELTIDNKKIRVYFITGLILGDNLGANAMCGFVESFSKAHCCRICCAGPDDIHFLAFEDDKMLRTVEKYENDIKHLDYRNSGIKELCVFNELIDYHVIENSTVDCMHDVFEGVCNYVITELLLRFVYEDKFFALELLNYRLRNMNFNFESSNKPPEINADYLRKNNKIRASAAEMLFLTRYFGVLVGDKIPRDNKYWSLYNKLHQIVSIITSPVLTASHILQLGMLIKEHNNLYIELFGNLKTKFHFLTHYVRMIEKNGPVIKYSSMRYESKHRMLKTIVLNSSSNRNILKSIATRYELSLMQSNRLKYENVYITYGKNLSSDIINNYFPMHKTKVHISNVVINDVRYSEGTVIIVSMDEDGPEFGKIVNVFVVDDTILFQYITI
ncbi:hypothetical protein TSAR_010190, partial [Trichomalopsis sarcophagae]